MDTHVETHVDVYPYFVGVRTMEMMREFVCVYTRPIFISTDPFFFFFCFMET
jgi:hypothetical protein